MGPIAKAVTKCVNDMIDPSCRDDRLDSVWRAYIDYRKGASKEEKALADKRMNAFYANDFYANYEVPNE